MKRVCIALMLLVLMSGASFGAVSDDVYVRKDVFEVYMQNINANMERILQRLDRIDEGLSTLTQSVATLSERVARLEGRMDGIEKRMDGIDTKIGDLRSEFTSRMDGLGTRISDFRSEVVSRTDGLDKRIDDLRNGIYLLLTLAGLVIAVLSWPKVQEKLKALGKSTPSITLEDVNRLIEANNDKLLKNLQAYAK